MENRSSHSVLKSSHQTYFLRTQSNFTIGLWLSKTLIENLSSHSVSKSSHLVIAKFSKKNFLLEISELSNFGLKKIFSTKKNFYRTQSNFVMGCPWSQRPMKNPASHSVSKSSNSVLKSTDSYKIFALSQFRYWPSMEQRANGKSILALSFEIFGLL